MNPFLKRNLGIDCKVVDTTDADLFISCSLARQKASLLQPALLSHGNTSELQVATHSTALSSSTNSDHQPVSSTAQMLVPFLTALIEMEHLPFSATSQRAARKRFLSSFYAASLPEAARCLVEVVAQLNECISKDVLEVPLSTSQPPKSSRASVQSVILESMARIKKCRVAIEDLLNDINEFPGDATDNREDQKCSYARDKVYEHCDVLYSDMLVPRMAVAEALLCCRTALAVRTEEVAIYAQRFIDVTFRITSVVESQQQLLLSLPFDQLCKRQLDKLEHRLPSMFSGARLAFISCQMLLQLVPDQQRLLLDGVGAIARLHLLVVQRSQWTTSGEALEEICNDLLGSGVVDGEAWMQDVVNNAVPDRSLNDNFTRAPAKRTMSFNSSTTGKLSLCTKGGCARMKLGQSDSATSITRSQVVTESIQQLMKLLDEIVATMPATTAETHVAVTQLYNCIGRVNMFLRRTGIARATMMSVDGKAVPTGSDDRTVYVEHHPDPQHGFGKGESVLYEQACLLYEMWSQQINVRSELDELLALNDEDFFRACHNDLLRVLFHKADEYCVATESRRAVERRFNQLMIIRIKVYHHLGEVHVLTVPQTTSLDSLRTELSSRLEDAKQCEFSFLDDGDKIVLSGNRDFEDLMRLRRNHVLEGISLSASQMGKSVVTTSELKVELYLDPMRSVKTSAGNIDVKSHVAQTCSKPPSEKPRSKLQEFQRLSANDVIRKAEEKDRANDIDVAAHFLQRKMQQHGLDPTLTTTAQHTPMPVKECKKSPPPQLTSTGTSSSMTPPQRSATRNLFLQMGKVKKDTASEEAPMRDIVVVDAHRAKWHVPDPSTSLDFAQHNLEESEGSLQQTVDDYLNDDDTEDSAPPWHRCPVDRVQEVNNTKSSPPLRYGGPLRRSGVPLPQTGKRKV